ncbi:MAG: glycosyltransferase family 2 protein [Actinomycetota bacterium]
MSRGSPPLVSVVIPTWNRPGTLTPAVRSVLSQTYSDLEVVVADDGSDPPATLPDQLRNDPRLRILRTESVMGPGATRNEAVRMTQGPLLAFLDDDDEWLPGKLARQVEVMQASATDVAVVETGFELWQQGRLLWRYLPREDRDLALTLLNRPALQPSCVLMRREVFDELGGFNPTLARTQDWELWVRLSDRYRVAVVREVLVKRRASEVPPREMLRAQNEIMEHIGPRIDRLPEPERTRTRAGHLFQDGVLLAMNGRPKEARPVLIESWRSNPSTLRPLFHVVRTFTGERVWAASARAAKPLVRVGRRVRGRDPFLREW